jgi:ketosteroid isomerase-like protein
MAPGDVELVRHAFEAFGRGDLETAFSHFGADVEWRMSSDEPDARTHKGIAAVRRFVDSLADPWADRFDDVMRLEPLIDTGDAIVVPWTARVTGRESRVVLDIQETYVVRVVAGRIVRVDEYRTTEEALRDT